MSFETFEKQLKEKKDVFSPTVSTQKINGGSSAFDSFESQVGVKTQNIKERAPDKGGVVGNMLKSVVTAPATMVARPFQAVQSAIQLGSMDIKGNEAKMKTLNDESYRLALSLRTAKEEDKPAIRSRIQEIQKQVQEISTKLGEGAKWKPSAGGIVAEAPENFKDVKKDVGRGIQTVALGVSGAPLASGAAFGFGSSLEQGNDVFSMDTLTSTLLGMGLGKATDLIGKPLLNAAGKVIGTITPLTLKNVAAKGANAVQNFMAQHELLGGIAKPISEKITQGAGAFDSSINKLFSGAKTAVTGTLKNQYPTMKDDIAKHYEKTEIDKLMKPTQESGATFNKATEVAKQAEARNIDLRKVAANNKVYISDHISDKKFNTSEIADALSDDAMSGGSKVFRPALAAAEPGSPRVPISEVRQRISSKISSIPDTVLSPEQKLSFAKKVAREYADNSVTAARYKNGYTLTNLYDSKLQTSSNLYKTPKGGGVQSISDTLIGQQKKIESDVFKELLMEKAPKNLGIDRYFKAQEEKFVLANYLRTLDGKTAPQTLLQRGVRRSSQLFGATIGAKTAGPFGMFSGYQFGGLMADTFASAPNPVKIAFLKSIGKTTPEIYGIMREFVSEQEAARLLRPLLPSGTKVDAALQRIKNEWGAIEMGYSAAPADTFTNNMVQNNRLFGNTKMLGAPEPRTITPNTQGTPNQPIAPYSSGGNQGDVGGMRQRLFRG
jgi:hypothetical protein